MQNESFSKIFGSTVNYYNWKGYFNKKTQQNLNKKRKKINPRLIKIVSSKKITRLSPKKYLFKAISSLCNVVTTCKTSCFNSPQNLKNLILRPFSDNFAGYTKKTKILPKQFCLLSSCYVVLTTCKKSEKFHIAICYKT